jgi:hypothetical protein
VCTSICAETSSSPPALSNEAGNLSPSSSYSTGPRLPASHPLALPSHGPTFPSPWDTTRHNTTQHSAQRAHKRLSHWTDRTHDTDMSTGTRTRSYMHRSPLSLFSPLPDTTRAMRRDADTVRAEDMRSVSLRFVSFCIHARNASQSRAGQSRAGQGRTAQHSRAERASKESSRVESCRAEPEYPRARALTLIVCTYHCRDIWIHEYVSLSVHHPLHNTATHTRRRHHHHYMQIDGQTLRASYISI